MNAIISALKWTNDSCHARDENWIWHSEVSKYFIVYWYLYWGCVKAFQMVRPHDNKKSKLFLTACQSNTRSFLNIFKIFVLCFHRTKHSSFMWQFDRHVFTQMYTHTHTNTHTHQHTHCRHLCTENLPVTFCDFARDIVRYLFLVIFLVLQIYVLMMVNVKIPALYYVDICLCFRGVHD